MTMKELAELAGVSPAAVSRYLNGGSLSEEKRAVIRRAIEQTGYQPDAAAQALRTKTTDIVGLIVPKLDSESVSRLVAGAEAVLAEEGFLTMIAVSHNDAEKELSFLQLLQKRSVAGVILMATVADERHQAAIRALRIPVVVTGQHYDGVSCVYHDDFNAARELARLVLQKGRRHPGFLGVTERDVAVGVERKRGVLSAMAEAGLAPELPTELCSFEIESGAEGMRRLLQAHPETDAVFCATDRIAFGAMEVLKAAGRRIGEDISLTGMGDSWASHRIDPNLTTAHFYYKTCGETAARRLLELIRSPAPAASQTKLSYTIKNRDSV